MPDDTGTFKAHPKTYLRGHPTLLRGFEGYTWSEQTGTTGRFYQKKKPVFTSRSVFNMSPGNGPHGEVHTYLPAWSYDRVDFRVVSNGPISEITIYKSDTGNTGGVVYLPFKENTTTVLWPSGLAHWFFTGPLEGCHIYIATAPTGPPIAIHANLNDVGNATTNANNKRAMAQHVIGGFPNYHLAGELGVDDYRPPGNDPYRAFVLGENTGGGNNGWKFHVHSINLRTLATVYAAKRIC